MFADSVHDHESMKIRICSAGHRVLADAGELLSVGTIAECTAHPQVSALFRKVQHVGIAPYVAPVPGRMPGACIGGSIPRSQCGSRTEFTDQQRLPMQTPRRADTSILGVSSCSRIAGRQLRCIAARSRVEDRRETRLSGWR